MRAKAARLLKRGAILVAVALVTFLAVRAWDSQRGLPLEVWHTHVPDDLTAEELEPMDWVGYLAAEQALFDENGAQLAPGLLLQVERFGKLFWQHRLVREQHVAEP